METTHERERIDVLDDGQERVSTLAANFAIVGLLLSLFAFFMAFAPSV